jgi:hypothetical protein
MNGITSLKKHVNANHFIIENLFEEEINNPLRGKVERQPAKKIHLAMQLLTFLLLKNLSIMMICNRKCFLRIWAC